MTSGGRLRRRNPSLVAESTEEEFAAFLELYLPSDAGPLRHSIVKGVTEISGVPQDTAGPSGLSSVLQECEARFEKAGLRIIAMKKQLFIPLVSLTVLNLVAAASAANWPSWRGDIAGSVSRSSPASTVTAGASHLHTRSR